MFAARNDGVAMHGARSHLNHETRCHLSFVATSAGSDRGAGGGSISHIIQEGRRHLPFAAISTGDVRGVATNGVAIQKNRSLLRQVVQCHVQFVVSVGAMFAELQVRVSR